MALSTWDVTRDSLILIKGDSLSSLQHAYRMMNPLQEACTAHYNPTRSAAPPGSGRLPSAGFRVPTFVNKSFTGNTIRQIEEQIDDDLAENPYTHVILPMGTNDRGNESAVTIAAIEDLAGHFTDQTLLIIGPYAWGEKWPSGENAFDTRLDEIDVEIPTYFLPIYPNACYVSLRVPLFEVLLPTINLPAPGVAEKILTEDEAHWNARGRAAAWDVIREVVRFT